MITQPVKLTFDPAEGVMRGNNGRYEKFIPDLAGLYRDDAAFAEALAADDGKPVYWVESSNTEPESNGGLITGISVLEPGRVGEEYAMTRGHIHANHEYSELYYCLAGHGIMLLETIDGRSEAVELRVGEAAYVPGHWVHRSVNVGSARFVTLFCYGCPSGQDYGIIERARGMKNLIVATEDGGWEARPNPDHIGYSG